MSACARDMPDSSAAYQEGAFPDTGKANIISGEHHHRLGSI
jgi:hypothetical protein